MRRERASRQTIIRLFRSKFRNVRKFFLDRTAALPLPSSCLPTLVIKLVMLAAVVVLVLYHRNFPPDGQVYDFYALVHAFTG